METSQDKHPNDQSAPLYSELDHVADTEDNGWIPEVDLNGLSAHQKKIAVKLLREEVAAFLQVLMISATLKIWKCPSRYLTTGRCKRHTLRLHVPCTLK